MSEMSVQSFEYAVGKYADALESFADSHEVPNGWFEQPDHVALKCLDAQHFEDTVSAWTHRAGLASYTYMDGRRLASLHLEEQVPLGRFGSVEWLEIMEPRPERRGLDIVGIDHAEFVFPHFLLVEHILAARGAVVERQQNPNHRWLSLVLNPQGQELKFNDRPLADIVGEEIRRGEAELL